MGKKNYQMRYITRVEYSKATPSWLVRIYTKFHGLRVASYFNDSEFGCKQRSLAAAKDYRDWIIKNWPVPAGYNGWNGVANGYTKVLRKNNTSGITGVFYSESNETRRRPDGTVYKRLTREWKAAWCENGKLKTRDFSVNLYGYEQARQLAIEWRARMVKKIEEDLSNPDT